MFEFSTIQLINAENFNATPLNYFVSNIGKEFPNYLAHFQRLSETKPKNPVIFIFDNELSNNSKPLANFANHIKLSGEKKDLLISTHKLHLHENLFLLTNPLVNEKKECEIEDLFSADVLKQEIRGKTFSREKNASSEKHYGKEIFASFIANNYESIDFVLRRRLASVGYVLLWVVVNVQQ